MTHLNDNFYIKNKKRNYIQNLGIEQIIDKAKAIQNDLLEFINEDSEIEEFTHKLETYQLLNNRYEFKNFLYMILNISNNHYRQNSFFTRIEQIIQFYKSEIQQIFSNFELFHIFQSNNRLLLFLIEHQILYIDETIFNIFNEEIKYREYFLPELNQYSKEKGHKNIEINDQIYDTSFYNYRKNGENEDYICQMIRNDSVIEFIQYTNKKNFPLKYKIKPSILETNSFLINRTPTMIEYSAFFGSFQIFQYLFKNEVKVDSNLWLYAIHGKNPEIIHFLEEIEIEPNIKCIKESIKCNHNEITEYLFDNYPDKFHRNEIDINSGIKYYNFNYFPTEMDIDLAFFYFCKFDNYYLVDYLLKTESRLNINYKKTKKKNYFFYGNQNFLYPIGVAAKNMNLDIFSLLLDQKNITIDEFCFYNCDKLEKISIPSSIQTIKSHTFDECFSLTEIIIPNSVTSIESFAFNNCKSLIRIIIPNSVTLIGEGAFSGCKSFIKMIIPNSVTLIGKGAFNKCRSLIEIIIPNSVKTIEENAFCECSSLTQITIPSSIIEINAKTFSNCKSLSQISIPFTIKRIGHDAFEECSSLQHIIYTNRSSNNLCLFGCSLLPHFTYYKPNYLHEPILLGESKNINFNKDFNENKTFSLCLSRPITQSTNNKNLTFYKCESLPQVSIPPFIKINKDIEDEDMKSRASMNISDKFFKNLEILPNIRIWDFFNIGTSKKFLSTKSHSIEINSFGNCSSLLEIEIPFSITSINDWSFSECSSLTTVIIPPSVKSIGNYVFYGCSSLKQITIPSSIEIIGKETFFKCSSLTEIIIPSSVTKIETGAFKKCSSLEKITFKSSSSLKIIDSYAFYKCSALKEIIIPPSVSYIERGAFSGCSSLNKITIPSSIQKIQPFTFNGCSSLEEINLPHLLKSIEKCSFKNCKSLKNIIIPSSVEYIYDYSFYGCQELTEVIILSSLTRIDEFSLPQNSLIIQFIQEP